MIETHDSQSLLAKIVFFGPAGSGKATTLHGLLERIPHDFRSDLSRINSHGDTLLSAEIVLTKHPPVAGRMLQIQLVTTTGPVGSEATWQRLLEDADGVVFVADSRVGMMAENVRQLDALQDTLTDLGYGHDDLPMVVQMNHRDNRRTYTIEELNARLNPLGGLFYETNASQKSGIFVVLKQITALVVQRLEQQLGGKESGGRRSQPTLDEPVQFGRQSGETASEENQSQQEGPRSSFSFPATKVTWDGKSPSPLGQVGGEGAEDDKGGLWRRLAKPFKK